MEAVCLFLMNYFILFALTLAQTAVTTRNVSSTVSDYVNTRTIATAVVVPGAGSTHDFPIRCRSVASDIGASGTSTVRITISVRLTDARTGCIFQFVPTNAAAMPITAFTARGTSVASTRFYFLLKRH